MECPDHSRLDAYLLGELRPRENGIVAKHLHDCEDCRLQVELGRARTSLFADAMAPRPDLEEFTASVLRRIRDGNSDT